MGMGHSYGAPYGELSKASGGSELTDRDGRLMLDKDGLPIQDASVHQLTDALIQAGCTCAKWLVTDINLIQKFMKRHDPPCTWPNFRKRLEEEQRRDCYRGQCTLDDAVRHISRRLMEVELASKRFKSREKMDDVE